MPKVIDLPTATTMDSGDYLIMEESSGGTKKITANNALTALQVGYTPPSAPADVTTVPSGTVTRVATITLPQGKWVISACARLVNASGSYRMSAAISTTTNVLYGYGFAQMSVESNNPNPALNVTRIVDLPGASGGTVNLLLYHTFGSTLTISSSDNRITAIRIA